MKKGVIEKIKFFCLKKDNLLICVLAGVLLLVITWPMEEAHQPEEETWDRGQANIAYEDSLRIVEEEKAIDSLWEEDSRTQKEQEVLIMEKKLEELLNMIEGVGEVKTMITLESLGEKVLEKDIPVERNVVTETDSQGGSRSTNNTNSQEATVYITDSKGSKIPYVITETLPGIRGITVVCQGGDNNLIQKNITEVIQALFGIDVHRIKIVKMKQIE